MNDHPRQELRELEANLRCYEDLIKRHNVHVEEATNKIIEAKQVLQNILDHRDKAPLLIQQTQIRIKAVKVKVSGVHFIVQKADPKVKRLLALREKLKNLEKELRT